MNPCEFSLLYEHKFRHCFESLSPICRCNKCFEDNEFFLLSYPINYEILNGLLDQLLEISVFELNNLSSKTPCNFLRFGKPH